MSEPKVYSDMWKNSHVRACSAWFYLNNLSKRLNRYIEHYNCCQRSGMIYYQIVTKIFLTKRMDELLITV